MFETSWLLFIWSVIVNLLVPLIPGILFLWIFFGTKISGGLLYLYGRFVGFGVVAFSLFNFQFIHQGLGFGEYLLLFLFLFLGRIIKVFKTRQSFTVYIKTLFVSWNFSELYTSWKNQTPGYRYLSLCMLIFVLIFLGLSFLYNISFPTYFDDSFGNWNGPSLKIFYDDGIPVLGERASIFGAGKVGYPLYAPLYKALIASFLGGRYDVYMDMWQRLLVFGIVLFSFVVTFSLTKNFFSSLLAPLLITGLPLVYFHSIDGYMDFPTVTYAILAGYCLYVYLKNNTEEHLVLGFLFILILSNIKNEGLVIYTFSLTLSFLLILFLKLNFRKLFTLIKNKILLFGGLLFFFFVPFLFIRYYHNVGLDPTSGSQTLLNYHPEVWNVFPSIFFYENNFNIILCFLIPLIWIGISFWRKKNYDQLFPLLAFVFIFVISILVFLFTENYQWALSQTTINRLFTMNFVFLCFFYPMILIEYDRQKK